MNPALAGYAQRACHTGRGKDCDVLAAAHELLLRHWREHAVCIRGDIASMLRVWRMPGADIWSTFCGNQPEHPWLGNNHPLGSARQAKCSAKIVGPQRKDICVGEIQESGPRRLRPQVAQPPGGLPRPRPSNKVQPTIVRNIVGRPHVDFTCGGHDYLARHVLLKPCADDRPEGLEAPVTAE